MPDEPVLLIDWDNLSAAVRDRNKVVVPAMLDAIWETTYQDFGRRSPKSHVAAPRLEKAIDEAAGKHFMERLYVRGAKEQADVALTVLAMDYLHQGYHNFVLVTGTRTLSHFYIDSTMRTVELSLYTGTKVS